MKKHFRNQTIRPAAFLTLLASLGLSPLSAMMIQDFESDTKGVIELPSSLEGLLTSVTDIVKRTDGLDLYSPTNPNGDFLGISPSVSGGSYYGEIRTSFEADNGTLYVLQGDRAVWNSGTKSGGFVSGEGFRMDVYFDDLSFYNANDGFFFQPTLLDNSNLTAVSGGGFAARVVNTGSGLVWRVGADGDAKGFSGVSGSTFDIASPGWYTMETIWVDDGVGNIDQENRLFDISGNTELTVVFEDVLAVGDAGQLGEASFGNGDEDPTFPFPSTAIAFAVDNLQPVPEPSAFALLTGLFFFTYTIVARRR